MPLDATALETLLEQVDAWKGRKQGHLVAEAEAGERGAAGQAPDKAGGEGAGSAAAEASTLAQQWEVRVGVGLHGWLLESGG